VRWLVGDIQGCARELDDLIAAIRFDSSRDELWCLGDFVNRGPDSLAALRLWRDVDGRGLIGNHDVYALRVRAGRKTRHPDQLEPLFAAADADLLLDRVRALPVLHHLPGDDHVRDVWIVHAGLHPQWTDLAAVAERIHRGRDDPAWLESDEVGFAIRVRCCDANGERSRYTGPPEECPEGFRPWDSFYRGDALIVHGHWAARGYYRGERTMGLDSGCCYGGKLTAWCQEEDRLVEVPARDA